jgi:CRP-like cAMP-binding protein
VRPPTEPAFSPRAVGELLRKVSLFGPLLDREIDLLAQGARRERFGPMDRLMHQGEEGTSLWIIESGEAEVLVRTGDEERTLSTLGPGAILGERGLLLGERRGATVRALGEVVALELTHGSLQPILRARPQLVVELSLLLAARQGRAAADAAGTGLADQIRRFFFRRG